MTSRIVRLFAVNAGGPAGRAATARLCRAVTDELDLELLMEVISRSPDPRSRDLVRDALADLWTRSHRHRIDIWTVIWWNRRLSWSDGTLPPTLRRFLLDADPESPYQPEIRLITGLSLGDDAPYHLNHSVVRHLREWVDNGDQDVAGVLSTTDQPEVLTELERVFAADVTGITYTDRFPPLWTEAGEPTPLMSVMLANPFLPRPATARTDPDLAVLMALKGRWDLLTDHAQVSALCRSVGSRVPRVAAACERALRSFPPGAARRMVRRLAFHGYDDVTAAAAAAAAADAGYLDDPSLGPLVLLLTRNWDRFHALDPDGEAFRRYRDRFPVAADWRPLWHVLHMLETETVPDTVERICLDTLADLRHPGDRDEICRFARYEGPETIRAVVVEARYLPSDEDEIAPFLYLTEQWERYDAADPDGERMRAYAEALAPEDTARDDIRRLAADAGRPPPCDATRPRPRRRGRGSSFSATGTGWFADPTGSGGGGFSCGSGSSGGFSCGGSVHT